MARERLEIIWSNRFHVWEGIIDTNSHAEYRSNPSDPKTSTTWYLYYIANYVGVTQSGIDKSTITLRLCRDNSGKKLQIKGFLYFPYPPPRDIKLYNFDSIMDIDTKHVTIFKEERSRLPTYSTKITCIAWITELTETGENTALTFPDSCKLLQDMYKMYKKQDHSDLIVICKDVEIRVHKCVLSARSEVFAEIIENLSAESNNRIIISDINLQVFSELLKFLYCGEIDASIYPKAHDLYYAAKTYRVSDLTDFCRDLIISSLSVTTAVETLILAHTHEDEEMMKKAISFIASSLQDVKSTKAWISLQQDSSLATHVISLFAEHLNSQNSGNV